MERVELLDEIGLNTVLSRIYTRYHGSDNISRIKELKVVEITVNDGRLILDELNQDTCYVALGEVDEVVLGRYVIQNDKVLGNVLIQFKAGDWKGFKYKGDEKWYWMGDEKISGVCIIKILCNQQHEMIAETVCRSIG